MQLAMVSLGAALSLLTGSELTDFGLPAGGSEQVAFMGNYSATAFGVHEGHEDAFLVHLGSGTKDLAQLLRVLLDAGRHREALLTCKPSSRSVCLYGAANESRWFSNEIYCRDCWR